MVEMRLVSRNGETVRSEALEQIARALTGLRFGSVEVVVHDGKITQIERREKVRIDITQSGLRSD